jgi:hypothetical protein
MEEKTMTLKEFIEKMCNGWGFARPGQVIQIGIALSKIIPEQDLNTVVKVKTEWSSSGYGPDFRYHYRWYIDGYKPPFNENARIVDTQTLLFGGYFPFIRLTEDGFVVGYDH